MASIVVTFTTQSHRTSGKPQTQARYEQDGRTITGVVDYKTAVHPRVDDGSMWEVEEVGTLVEGFGWKLVRLNVVKEVRQAPSLVLDKAAQALVAATKPGKLVTVSARTLRRQAERTAQAAAS